MVEEAGIGSIRKSRNARQCCGPSPSTMSTGLAFSSVRRVQLRSNHEASELDANGCQLAPKKGWHTQEGASVRSHLWKAADPRSQSVHLLLGRDIALIRPLKQTCVPCGGRTRNNDKSHRAVQPLPSCQ